MTHRFALIVFCGILALTRPGELDAGQPAHSNTANQVSEERTSVVTKDVQFRSASLQRDMRYRILFPAGYNEGEKFPVLYLLHGIYGDYLNWDTRTGLEKYARPLHFLVVMPDGDDSWYSNSVSVPADKFEDYIVKDLISDVDGKFKTIRNRSGRAIAGLSMGGYGAVKTALKHPELFAFAGSLSGALNAAKELGDQRPNFQKKLLEVFGNDTNSSRADNDVFLVLDSHSQATLPYFYLACGTSDYFLDTNRAFAKSLATRKVIYEYHETSGGHGWEYWDRALSPLLQAAEKAIATGPPPTKSQSSTPPD